MFEDFGPDADPDLGYAMITGFARATAEVSAAMNMSPMGASHRIAQAEALDTRLPTVAALLAEGNTDWHTVQVIITRTELVRGARMADLDASRRCGWSSARTSLRPRRCAISPRRRWSAGSATGM